MSTERRITSWQGTARRWKTFLPVTLDSAAGSARGHILNLSVGGALLHSTLTHRVGTVIRVTLGDFHISGRVAWREGERFGLAFLTAIPVLGLQQMLDTLG